MAEAIGEKRIYGNWSESSLRKAIKAYKNRNVGLNECSRVYGIPKATIKRHADNNNRRKTFGRPPTFNKDMEKALCEHLLMFEERFFGFTVMEARKLAYAIAEKLKIPHKFNKDKKMAGKKWYYAFMTRNPQLSLCQRKGTSLARARGFNREDVNHFFDLF